MDIKGKKLFRQELLFSVRFLLTDGFAMATSGKVAAEAQADAFLAEYGAAFGINDAAVQLSPVNTVVDQYGLLFLKSNDKSAFRCRPVKAEFGAV